MVKEDSNPFVCFHKNNNTLLHIRHHLTTLLWIMFLLQQALESFSPYFRTTLICFCFTLQRVTFSFSLCFILTVRHLLQESSNGQWTTFKVRSYSCHVSLLYFNQLPFFFFFLRNFYQWPATSKWERWDQIKNINMHKLRMVKGMHYCFNDILGIWD